MHLLRVNGSDWPVTLNPNPLMNTITLHPSEVRSAYAANMLRAGHPIATSKGYAAPTNDGFAVTARNGHVWQMRDASYTGNAAVVALSALATLP